MNVHEWIRKNFRNEDFERVLQSKRPRKKLISLLAPEFQNGACNYRELVEWIRQEAMN